LRRAQYRRHRIIYGWIDMSRVFPLHTRRAAGVVSRRAAGLRLGVSAAAAMVLLLPGLAAAEPMPPVDEYAAQWGLGMIGAKAAHDRGYTGSGVTVGVVDSGVLPLHPDLVANLSDLSYSGVTGLPVAADGNGHGTHVAGTIAATLNGVGMVGVAPGAKVAPLQLANDAGNIDQATLDQVVSNVYAYGLANGIEFYNNSWGSDPVMPASGPDLEAARHYFEVENPNTLAAFRSAANAGSVLVWAAGNDGLASVAYEPGLPVLYPELQANWIAVAAVGQTGEVTDYSNRCGIAAAWCLSAPGGDDDQENGGIYSTANDGTYVRMSGTSMAAPHVTGALAIARQMFPNAKATDLAQLVLATATDVGAAGIDDVYGWGILNLDNLTSTRDAATGAVYSQGAFAQTRTLGQIADIAGNLSGSLGGGDPAPGGVTLSTHGAAPTADMRMRWWLAPMAGFTQTSASATTASAITRTGGAITGLDFRPSEEVRFGFGVGFSQSRTGSAGNKVSSTGVHGLAYAGYSTDVWFTDGGFGVSRFETKTTRSGIAGLGGAAAGLTGKSSGTDVGAWGNARVGMTFATLAATLQPYAQARAVHQWLGSQSESGAGIFGLSAASATTMQTDLGAGVRVTGNALALGAGAELRPVVDVAYARAIGSLGDSRSVTMLGSPVAASAVGVGRDIARLGAGLTYTAMDGRLSGSLGYAGEFRARATSHALNASIGLRF
jgi:hypothetical protein